jgi:hypothetical protein
LIEEGDKSYKIKTTGENFPVDNYVAHIRVSNDNSKTTLHWDITFDYKKDTNDKDATLFTLNSLVKTALGKASKMFSE